MYQHGVSYAAATVSHSRLGMCKCMGTGCCHRLHGITITKLILIACFNSNVMIFPTFKSYIIARYSEVFTYRQFLMFRKA